MLDQNKKEIHTNSYFNLEKERNATPYTDI